MGTWSMGKLWEDGCSIGMLPMWEDGLTMEDFFRNVGNLRGGFVSWGLVRVGLARGAWK